MKKKVLVFIVCVMMLVFGVVGCGEETQPDPKMYAYFYSQDIVKENLKAPSTANFPLYSDVTVTTIGENAYRVRAYVDAQNSFGGLIRSNYTVEITFNPTEQTYTYKNLKIN